MRGVVTAGMVVALEQLDLVDSFDRVYGCSAGATNGAYLVAGQAALGTTIYYENLNTGEFINPWAWLRGKPVVDGLPVDPDQFSQFASLQGVDAHQIDQFVTIIHIPHHPVISRI